MKMTFKEAKRELMGRGVCVLGSKGAIFVIEDVIEVIPPPCGNKALFSLRGKIISGGVIPRGNICNIPVLPDSKLLVEKE